jgi:hypothetical protein
MRGWSSSLIPSNRLLPYVKAMARSGEGQGRSRSKRFGSRESGTELDLDGSQLYQEVKDKYKSLMHVLSRTEDDEPASGEDSPLSHVEDRSVELELQQWNSMWQHLVSMVTQVLEVNSPIHEISSPAEKRALLVNLIGQLCQAASQPIDPARFQRLNAKYHKCRDSLRLLKSQSQTLLHEVEKNKLILEDRLAKPMESAETQLVARLKELEDAFQKQFAAQNDFLHEEEPTAKPVARSPPAHRRKPIPLDLLDDEITPIPTRSSPAHRHPRHQRVQRALDDDDDASGREDARERMKARRQREAARREADEVSASAHQIKRNPIRGRPGDVDPLVGLTHRLQEDYRRLGQYSDLSMRELARLNESLDRERVSSDQDVSG